MPGAKPAKGNTTENMIESSGLPLIFKAEKPSKVISPQGRLPAYVQTNVQSLTVFQKRAFVSSARGGLTWCMASDEGKYLLGHDAAPAPLAFLTVGMVSSYMNELLALAKLRQIELKSVKLIQDNFYTMSGSMKDGSMLAGADHVDLEAIIDADADRDVLTQLISDAIAASPLNGLMRGTKESLFTLTHNQNQIDTAKALQMDVVAPLPEDQLHERVAVSKDAETDILTRGPLTPKSEISDTSVGSSLATEQNRLLHLRGICTVRDDGIKHIEQQLFNPHGSIFCFLSDESEADGGTGMAPSAADYISAGIGFCFMTQFGRFAKMQNSKLSKYSIVQDSFFSLGGASGGTGKPGSADPLETHVYLESAEDDKFAQDILDIAEQTCFLHAFCRTDLKVKVKLTTL